MKNLTTEQVRKGFINFFTEKYEHKQIPGSSIIPEDNSVLLTSAGMQQLIPYLMGTEHPEGGKLCSIQDCFRTTDIEEIGDESHGSYFEMLGNWSLGTYFKKEAITMAWDYLTNELEIDPEKLSVTVFEGNDDIPFDQEAKDIWLEIGVPKERIKALGVEDNFWIAGETGPCGGDTEIFYDRGSEFTDPEERYMEIWNLVFMEYHKDENGVFTKLEKQNVDTGMGLMRIAMVLQGKRDVYETDELMPLIEQIEKLSGKTYREEEESTKAMRILVDHVRAVITMANAGIVPANLGREYLMRRLIRRAVRYARTLNLADGFVTELAELAKADEDAIKVIGDEEKAFQQTIQKGLKELEKLQAAGTEIDGEKAFFLYETYGFPLELTEEIIEKKIDQGQFKAAEQKHQEVSRAGAVSKAGGVGECGIEGAPNHSATHLLHQALKDVLGDEVEQRGSDVSPERLRFDFNYPDKMTPEQIKEVEDIVNTQIQRELPVSFAEMTVQEAKDAGAIGIFSDKYGDKINVYTMGDYSKEICGGPHVENTAELKNFKILSEKSSSKGVRRIKAVTNHNE